MERLRRVTEELMLPPPLEVNFTAIPEALQARSQWVVWTYRMQDGEIKKPPFSPKTGKPASVTRPDTWGSVDDAQKAYETGNYAGVGFVLTSGVVGIDIDHCISGETISDEASLLSAALNTYTELSPSGTGLHLLMEGSLPGHFRRKDTVEMYQDGRYLTVTGQSVQEPPLPISGNQHALEAVYHHIFAPSSPLRRENTGAGQAHRAEGRSSLHRTDEEVLEKASSAKNGANFRRYYEGDYSLFEGKGARHRSHSEADFTLVLLLLYWTNNDTSQVDRLFRRSGLMREKWDRPSKDNETYGQRLISDALRKGTRH
jgi:putative DNA primase/helicase